MLDLDEVKGRLSRWAEETPEVQYVALFGSRVMKTHRPDSDLDVAIRVAGKGGEIATFIFNHDRWKAEIEGLLGFSPAHLTPVYDVLEALKEGSILVYERPPVEPDFSNVVTYDFDEVEGATQQRPTQRPETPLIPPSRKKSTPGTSTARRQKKKPKP